jgi:hypothetical protein
MAGERNRIPVDSDYIAALGLATYAFARCEWQVVWCCEKLKPGSLAKITGKEMTAGTIARYFSNLVRNMPNSDRRTELSALSEKFESLVDTRNRIIHGKPCTAPGGAQRLSSGGIIETREIEAAADAFATCSRDLNKIYYEYLNSRPAQE